MAVDKYKTKTPYGQLPNLSVKDTDGKFTYPINIPEDLNNPVWYMTQFLIRNACPSDYGLLSHTHNMVNQTVLPTSQYTVLELGDPIEFDAESFAAAGISVWGVPFTNKLFLITSINVKEDVVIIRDTIEINQTSIKPKPPNPFD